MNPWRDLAGLPPAVWALAAATFVNRAGSMAVTLLALYLHKEIGFTEVHASLVVGAYGLTGVVMGPISGRICDHVGARAVIHASLLLGGICFLAFPLVRSPWQVVVMTVLLAATSEPFRPANLVLIASLVPPEQRRQAFVLQRIALNLGLSIGPALGGLLAKVSYTSVFLVNGGASLAALAVLGLGLRAAGPIVAHDRGGQAAPPRTGLDTRFVWFLVATLVIAIVFFQHGPPMSFFIVNELHLDERHYGLTFTLNTILIVLIEARLNAAMAAWPLGKTLALGAALTSVGFASLALASDMWTMFATVPIWTFGEMILFPAMSSFVAAAAPPGKTGFYMGAYSMAFNLAYAVGPWAGTWLLEHHGATALWLVAGAVGLIPALMFRAMDRARA